MLFVGLELPSLLCTEKVLADSRYHHLMLLHPRVQFWNINRRVRRQAEVARRVSI
jgi:hypothetical protein